MPDHIVLIVNGTDITQYVAYGGFKWTRSDIDGDDAGRTQDGLMHRNRIATKDRLDITIRPTRTNEIKDIIQALEPEFVNVTYTSPRTGLSVTKTMYSNNIPAQVCWDDPDGETIWEKFTFPLIER